MGYAMASGHCIGCQAFIPCFNPAKVPSLRHPKTGQKEPLCPACFDRWNQIHRVEKGLEPFPLQPGAYDACDERELGGGGVYTENGVVHYNTGA